MSEDYLDVNKPHTISEQAMQLINKIVEFDYRYPTALEPEFLDFLAVVEFGLNKHPTPPGERANWLTPNGSTTSHNDMHDRIGHHWARSFTNSGRLDAETPLDHLLFVICRATMAYTRIKRGLVNDKDK